MGQGDIIRLFKDIRKYVHINVLIHFPLMKIYIKVTLPDAPQPGPGGPSAAKKIGLHGKAGLVLISDN